MRWGLFGFQVITLTLVLAGCQDQEDVGGARMQTTDEASTSVSETSEPFAHMGEVDQLDNSPWAPALTWTAPNCAQNDAWEPNYGANEASAMDWQTADEFTAYINPVEAYLCAGESDWYRFDVEKLRYSVHNLVLRVLLKDAGLCGLPCEQPVIEAGSEHAMSVEIYRADTMTLLGTTIEDSGVLRVNGAGEDFAHDLLIRVFSPNLAAEYPYNFSLSLRNYDGEDECEC